MFGSSMLAGGQALGRQPLMSARCWASQRQTIRKHGPFTCKWSQRALRLAPAAAYKPSGQSSTDDGAIDQEGRPGGTLDASIDYPSTQQLFWGYREHDVSSGSSEDYPSPHRRNRGMLERLTKGTQRRLWLLRRGWSNLWGRALYRYFNWREGTHNDLQLIVWLNVALFLLGAIIEGEVVRRLEPPAAEPSQPSLLWRWWSDVYQVMQVVFGQDLPDASASLASQVFAALAAIVGLASFALVLALMEQVVLEVLDSNVKRGSQVYEEGHVVVLTWGDSARDLGMVKRLLAQIVDANKAGKGGTVVVLAQDRPKLELESIFREAIPGPDRHGTQFVFRQGSPLDPASLRLVAAAAAQAVIITGNYSRAPADSDSQCLRAAVLLDEMMEAVFGEGGRTGPRVVVQVQTPDTLPLLHYTCSDRVLPVPTSTTIARRIARILRHPVIAIYSHSLTDLSSSAHAAINYYPQLAGLQFKDLHARFPYAIVVGLINNAGGYCAWNPHPSTLVQVGDEVMMMRPGPLQPQYYPPLDHPPEVDLGDWCPEEYVLRSQDEQPLGIDARSGCINCPGNSPRAPHPTRKLVHQVAERGTSRLLLDSGSSIGTTDNNRLRRKGLFILPLQYSNTMQAATDLLICGWGQDCLMWSLLEELSHGTQPLPSGACITLVNEHTWAGDFRELCKGHGVTGLCLRHVKADPRSMDSLQAAVDISKFQAAVVLCDQGWVEEAAGGPEATGHHALSQSEMLRLDAAVLQVQLNIRLLLEVRGCPDINIITERNTYIGSTRFETPTRLPLGVILNSSSFAAKLLTMVALEPRFMIPYANLGKGSDMVVQDSSSFAAEGEQLSWLQLQARAASVHQILMGYYRLPSSLGMPLEVVPNPLGLRTRMQKRVWNRGDYRCKLVTMAKTTTIDQARSLLSSSMGSIGTVVSVETEEEEGRGSGGEAARVARSRLGGGWSGSRDRSLMWEEAASGAAPAGVGSCSRRGGRVGAGQGSSSGNRDSHALGGDILE